MFNWIGKAMQSLNSSRFFAGLVMLALNIGSKYITIDLTAAQKKHLQVLIALFLISIVNLKRH